MILPDQSITVSACAKVNLVLRVLGKRACGLHEIRSLICPISLRDSVELMVERRPGVPSAASCNCEFSSRLHAHIEAIRRTHPDAASKVLEGLAGRKNLALRAAEVLFEKAALKWGLSVAIRIVKDIPLAAGLGGGSSDAAAVLRGLKEILELGLEEEDLIAIASSLGSDVPAMLQRRVVFVHGTGSKCLPVTSYPAQHDGQRKGLPAWAKQVFLLVLKPLVGVSTADAYRALGREESVQSEEEAGTARCDEDLLDSIRTLGFLPLGERADIARPGRLTTFDQRVISGMPHGLPAELSCLVCLCNDFQAVLLRDSPDVRKAFELLRAAGAICVLLAGSGSACIGFFAGIDQRNRALALLEDARSEGWYVAPCEFVAD